MTHRDNPCRMSGNKTRSYKEKALSLMKSKNMKILKTVWGRALATWTNFSAVWCRLGPFACRAASQPRQTLVQACNRGPTTLPVRRLASFSGGVTTICMFQFRRRVYLLMYMWLSNSRPPDHSHLGQKTIEQLWKTIKKHSKIMNTQKSLNNESN